MRAHRTVRLRWLAFALLPLPVLLAGCDKDRYGLIFSHQLHVEENEMDCDECHGEVSEAGFSVITHETCSDCHDEPEAEEISRKTCGLCHREENLEELEAGDPGVPRTGPFVHTEALEGKCGECHGTIMAEDLDRVPRMRPRDVLRIREQSHAQGMDCNLCHVGMDPEVPPADHDRDWMRRHCRR